MSLSNKIQKIRKERNLTQENLAEELNVSRQTISNWENKNIYPDIETLVLISNKFNISLDSLLKEDTDFVRDIDKKVKSNKTKKIIIIILLLLLLILSTIEISINYFTIKKAPISSIGSRCLLYEEKINIEVSSDIKDLTEKDIIDHNKLKPVSLNIEGNLIINNLNLKKYKSSMELLNNLINKIESLGGTCGLNNDYKENLIIDL